jgi:hypothetical protein
MRRFYMNNEAKVEIQVWLSSKLDWKEGRL